MTSKFIKVWTITGLRKSVKAATLKELKEKGSVKLNIEVAPDKLTVFLDDGTEVDNDEVFESLSEGTVTYLCLAGENPTLTLDAKVDSLHSKQQGGEEKQPKVISLPLSQGIKLHEAKNRWKPFFARQCSEEKYCEIMELYKKVRGILNKLTPQKFETLVEQMKNFDINTEEKLNGVIDLVFETAIDEPIYSFLYANMCKQLALIKMPIAGQPGQYVNFRKLLLTKCQKEFEQYGRDEQQREILKAMETASPEERKVLKMEFDMEEKKMRYRQLGNIRFMGEMFKLGMLIEPIMHECIKKFLTQADEESLECLCILLKTIGKELEEKGSSKGPGSNHVMNSYFNNKMQGIVDKRCTSPRIRFMLQDVIEFKRNNWIPRRVENLPKTIDQIHREAEKEGIEQQQKVYNANMAFYPKRWPDDKRKVQGRMSEDRSTPIAKNIKGHYNTVDPPKLIYAKLYQLPQQFPGPTQYSLISPHQNYFVNAYNNEPPPKANESQHQMPLIQTVAPAQQQLQQPSQQPRKEIPIIDPATGKNILERGNYEAGPPKENNLAFTVSPTKVVHNELSTAEISEELKKLLESTSPDENEKVFDWINGSIYANVTTSPSFIRALTSEVHKICIKADKTNGGKLDLDENLLKKRLPLLRRYINHNENFELQALYAIQKLISDLGQPKGVLRSIFYCIYDEDVITKETFKQWEQSKDPNEADGKSVALLSVRGFFTWLLNEVSNEDE